MSIFFNYLNGIENLNDLKRPVFLASIQLIVLVHDLLSKSNTFLLCSSTKSDRQGGRKWTKKLEWSKNNFQLLSLE